MSLMSKITNTKFIFKKTTKLLKYEIHSTVSAPRMSILSLLKKHLSSIKVYFHDDTDKYT